MNHGYKSHIINGTKYNVRIDSSQTAFRVTTDGKAPQLLSKYYSLNERSVLSFVNSCVYASPPHKFNDIFDSLFELIHYEKMRYEELWKIYKLTYNTPLQQVVTQEKLERLVRKALKHLWNESSGILCLTDNQTSDLMWAHYSQNNGFLVEYDTFLFPKNFNSAIRINYIPEQYDLKINPTSAEELWKTTLIVPFIKKILWEYESEYRILINQPKSNTDWRLQKVPQSSIQKLILAPHFFNELYDICSDEKHIIEFNRKKGLIRKLLIDHAIQIGIPIEHAMIELNSRCILNRKIEFDKEKLKKGVYQLKYMD